MFYTKLEFLALYIYSWPLKVTGGTKREPTCCNPKELFTLF